MAKKKQSKKGSVSVRKKKWVKIKAPPLFSDQVIGESYVGEPEELIGRRVSVSMLALTGESQRQCPNIEFQITQVNKEGVVSEFVGCKILPASLKKMVRRRRDKVSDSFVVRTNDKKLLRVKPIVVTRGKTTGSVLTAIRKLARAYLAKVISEKSAEDFVSVALQKRIQKEVCQVLKRLHPISDCEFSRIELISEQRVKDLKLKITIPPTNLPDFVNKIQVKEPPKRPARKAEPKPVEEAPAPAEEKPAPVEEAKEQKAETEAPAEEA